MEGIFQQVDRFPDIFGKAECNLFLVRLKEVPEVVDGLRHVLDKLHRPVYRFGKVTVTELTDFVVDHQPLDKQSESIERLPPLVRDVADHLSHCRLAALLDQQPFVLPEPLHRPHPGQHLLLEGKFRLLPHRDLLLQGINGPGQLPGACDNFLFQQRVGHAQVVVGPFPFRDVVDVAGEADDRAVLVAPWFEGRLEEAVPAVENEGKINRCRIFAGDDLPFDGGEEFRIFAAVDIVIGLAEVIFRAERWRRFHP